MTRLTKFEPRSSIPPESRRPRRKKDARLICLLTPLPKGKQLSLALVHYLAEEIPDVRFTLDPREQADAIWVCGYGGSAANYLGRVRALHPDATIVVTGRAPAASWASSVIDAGADYACSWPVDYCLLGRILHQKHVHHASEPGLALGLERSGGF